MADHTVATIRFGLIQGVIGSSENLIAALRWTNRDADTNGDGQPVSYLTPLLCFDRFAKPLTELMSTNEISSRWNNCELFAAESSDDIFFSGER